MSRSRVLSRVRAVPGLGRNVVTLLGMVVLGVVVTGLILSQQRVSWPWQDTYQFHAAFHEVPGISPGNGQEVRIAGVPTGWITAAEVDDEGRAVLTMEIDRQHAPVHDNAHVVLRPKSPLNEMYVELDPGSPPSQPLADGEILPTTQTSRPIQIEEPLTHLDDTARTALRSLLAESDAALADAGNDLPAVLDQLGTTAESLRPVVEGLDTRRELIRRLVSSLGDIAAATGDDNARLRELVAQTTATLETIQRNDGAVRQTLEQLPGVTDELAGASRAVSALTAELDPALDDIRSATEELPPGLAAVTDLLDQADDTLDLAAPVLDDARPLLADLRPLVADLRPSIADLDAVAPRLGPLTQDLAFRLSDLQAFVYNTESVMSTEDANGPIFRGLLQVNESAIPLIPAPAPIDDLLGDRP